MNTLRDNRTTAYHIHSEDSLANIQEHQLAWTANIRNAALLKEPFSPVHSSTIAPPKNPSEVEYIEIMDTLKQQHNDLLKKTHRAHIKTQYRHTGVFTEATDEASLHVFRPPLPNVDDDSFDSYYVNNNDETNPGSTTNQTKKKKIIKQWSCCASSDPNARGCVVVKQNTDRWCYG